MGYAQSAAVLRSRNRRLSERKLDQNVILFCMNGIAFFQFIFLKFNFYRRINTVNAKP